MLKSSLIDLFNGENVHAERFHNDGTKVGGIKYILSGIALQWYNDIPAVALSGNLDDLRDHLYARELLKYKYVPGSTTLPMLNRFQVICNKLNWPIVVQLEKIVRILPMDL